MKRVLTIALGAAMLLGGSTPALAGTNEAKTCATGSWVKVQVNRYTTSCKLGRAVANRLVSAPTPYPRIIVRGVRLRFNRPDCHSYYLWNASGKELSVDFRICGG